MEIVDRESLDRIRELGSSVIRNLALFMDNPFEFADKLEEASDKLDEIVAIRDELGLEGDGTQLPSRMGDFDFRSSAVDAGLNMIRDLVHDFIGGDIDERN